MKSKFYITLFTLALLWVLPAGAQDGYKAAVGLRLGSPLSASGKLFISEKGAIEAYVGTSFWYTGYSSVSLNIAYLVHESLEIEDFEGLRYYYGGGVGTQFWRYDNDFLNPGNRTSLSVSGYIGLDYYFEDVPINVSLDWRPTIFIGSILRTFGGRYGSVSVRYIIPWDN